MTPKIVLLLSICFSMFSCYPPCQADFDQSFETTVKVIDGNGNPVKNKEILVFRDDLNSQKAFKDLTPSFQLLSANTDNSGNVLLKYNLPHNCDVSYRAVIFIKEDSIFQAANFIWHIIPNVTTKNTVPKAVPTIKLSGTIVMDSLVPFKVRIKSNRANINSVRVSINSRSTSQDSLISRKYEFSNVNISSMPLDTTIITKVYSKISFNLNNSLILEGGILITGKTYKIDNTINHNMIFLDEIN